jgi:DNA-binding SARP family transcriptional activator/tetratricopeptide (TPR) repeat protein
MMAGLERGRRGMVEIRLLGPVELRAHGVRLPVGPPQQQRVLAVLAAEAGRAVALDTVLDRVWDEPPHGARRTLHVLVTRLRRVLARSDPEPVGIAHRDGGYALELDPDRVDLPRLRRLVRAAAETGRPDPQRLALLREATALWRGQPLAGLPGRWPAQARDAWEQQYLDAATAWAQAELRAGNPVAVIGPITGLVEAHPLVEPLAAVLMRALSAAGRRAEAVDRYAAVRRRLADELGIDPGPELQAVHRSILRGRPGSPAAVPAQLPTDVAAFTGRTRELGQLDALLPGTPDPAPVVIGVVSGGAGTGKTALAVHWAHQHRRRFRDGQLYLNLRGYDPGDPMPAHEALTRFLTALGTARADIPDDVDERAARYRTAVSGRAMLIVLDNAATVDQVRPLLPGTAPSLVLVTSRDSMAGLVALDGAHRLDLGRLPASEALALLRRLIGDRVDAEPGPAAVLAEQCSRLPLALRVCAELAVSRPDRPLAALTAELADERQRLDLLSTDTDPRADITAVFSWSVRHLPPPVAPAFILLGLHPGPDLTTDACAALVGLPPDDARPVLAVLVRTHLLEPTAPDRYGQHDLLRVYAAGLARHAVSPADRRAALRRLFDYYLHTAADAVAATYATTAPIPSTDPPGRDRARAWLDAETTGLARLITLAADDGWPQVAIRLATILVPHLTVVDFRLALAVHRYARDAARLVGDPCAEGHALLVLAGAALHTGRHTEALAHGTQALAVFRAAADPAGQARALGQLALIHAWMDRDTRSTAHDREALTLGRKAVTAARRACDPVAEAIARSALGRAESRMGRPERAAEHHRRAADLFHAAHDHRRYAAALDELGSMHLALGRAAGASRYFQAALDVFNDIGDPLGQAWALNGLGEAAYHLGCPSEAATHHTAAHAAAVLARSRSQHTRAHAGLDQAQNTTRTSAQW